MESVTRGMDNEEGRRRRDGGVGEGESEVSRGIRLAGV